jgi:REP element-mobilizing transposase RayT
MSNDIISYRRNLPHIQPKDAMFFVTFRLAGSLPAAVVERLRKEKEHEINSLKRRLPAKDFEKEKYKLEKRYFGKFDHLLDEASSGPLWLKEPRLAQIVAAKIHELDGKRYLLLAYCIMANHVHLLFDTAGFSNVSSTNIAGAAKKYPLTDTLRLLKGSTARLCNLALERGGEFWHHESYDHYIRDDEELYRIIEYILNNPVKAGLVENWQQWKFSYLKP